MVSQLKRIDIRLLTMTAKGFRQKEIADKEGIDVCLVWHRLYRLRKKFKSQTTAQMIAKAIACGEIENPYRIRR